MCDEKQIELIISKVVSPELTDVKTKMGVMATVLDHVAEHNAEIKDDIKEINKTLRGNGKEGLLVTVAKNSKFIENQTWFQRLAISSILGELVALVILVAKLLAE